MLSVEFGEPEVIDALIVEWQPLREPGCRRDDVHTVRVDRHHLKGFGRADNGHVVAGHEGQHLPQFGPEA